MVEKGVKPNEYTIAAVLSACSKSGALGSGIRVHCYVLDNGIKLDRAIGTALIDMYAKCGEVDCAATVFSNMRHKDILSWTAMIQGWAVHGRFKQAILCFRQMMYAGEKPDEVVFLAVLTACLNSGEVDLGINFFDSMRLDYAIEPTLKHYVLVVDLLSRAGKLNEAHELIENMPINPDLTTWAALYRACKAHKSNRRCEMVSQNLLEIDPELCGDYSHKQKQEIRLKLEEIVSLAIERGYIPGADWSIHDIEEEEKENVTGIHSEKLALALGLLRTAPGTVIRIVKNLRICGECHYLMKHVTRASAFGIGLIYGNVKFKALKILVCHCIVDVYALRNKKDLQNPILVSLFVVGDWVTAMLFLAAASSSAGVVVLYSRDLGYCDRHHPEFRALGVK
ncbi:hypothetical protein AALP_AA1G043600 [Arabis alpina]|uniref:DYW domain-containing protein n=1 Tax=Arabis alpina TaxID=50452 RepID=A0A087HL19_ARAAL|nr:hypothetical protein AALP_AA1G043600 [Arabis alpina]